MAKYFARRPHEYDGIELDRGQVIDKLHGLRNDEKLLRLGYLAPVPRDTVLKECGECQEKFIGEDERAGHYKLRHKERFVTPEDEDAMEERDEKKVNEIAPLFLDKTLASQGGPTTRTAAVQR